MRKKAVGISMHAEDEEEGWYLHRKITVDENGWHEELDIRHVNGFIAQCGAEHSRTLAVSGHMVTTLFSVQSSLAPTGAVRVLAGASQTGAVALL